MIDSILIANRGEIACRIIRTAQRLGIRSVAVYSDADEQALHVRLADEAAHIGEAAAQKSYLNAHRLIAAAQAAGVQAIHPGYGFLSENADFADAVRAAGLIFIGPDSQAIRSMGLKDAAKNLMERAGVPVVPGYHGEEQSIEVLRAEAAAVGYPVLIKARAGGGGRGMRRVDRESDLEPELLSAQREARNAFGDDVVLLEKYIESPRHVEVQVFGDLHGQMVHLYERDCSLQRRHQKVIEEAPAPGISEKVREAMTQAALAAARAIDYHGAGTVEFIADGSKGLRADGFWFMEMNTRLQVEHPVTEYVTGIDLVEWQILVASGQKLPLTQQQITLTGHAMEARVYAEDASNGFLPSSGRLQHLRLPTRVRVDTGVSAGDTISSHYDPMIAKLVSFGLTREQALRKLILALGDSHIAGTSTNLEFLGRLCRLDAFEAGSIHTGIIDQHLATLTGTEPGSDLHGLLAAIALLNIDLNDRYCGWRLWGQSTRLLTLQITNVSKTCRLNIGSNRSFSLTDEGDDTVLASCSVVSTARERWQIDADGCRYIADVQSWQTSDERHASVSLNGQSYTYSLIAEYNAGGISHDLANDVVAPMTGVIRAVDVQVGQRVEQGERLVMLEAMKMETSVVSPRDGVVSEVNCATGDSVGDGQKLIALEPVE